MFYALEGLAVAKKNGFVAIKVGGIHFSVYTSFLTYMNIELNSKVKLFIEFVVGENSFRLYGFSTEEEKYLFNELRKITKIGARIAMSILSKFSAQELKSIIANKQIEQLLSVPGVGKKTASTIMLELSDKILESDEKLIEVLNILTNNLGFAKERVYPILDKIYHGNEAFDTTELLKETLKKLRQ